MTVKERYLGVLESFSEKVKKDPNVIALILSGSLSYGTVWEKSDMDLTLLVRDGSIPKYSFYMMEEDEVEIEMNVMEVKAFKSDMSMLRAGESFHGYYGKSRFVFSKDPALIEVFEETTMVGLEDTVRSSYTRIQFMLSNMKKAEKWVKVFHDPLYAQHFLQWCATSASEILILLSGEEPDRECLLRAAELYPEKMKRIFEAPSTRHLTEEEVLDTLKYLTELLEEKIDLWSAPLLKYVSDGEIKTASEFQKFFGVNMTFVLDFLVERGMLIKVTKESRLFKHSSLTVEELAYFRAGE